MEVNRWSSLRWLATPPVYVKAGAAASEAARCMAKNHVGSLIVEEDGAPVGLVTDRDLTLGALGREPGTQQPCVLDLASRPLIRVDENASLSTVTRLFARHCIRRVALTNSSGDVVGVLSSDVVLKSLGRPMEDLTQTIEREFAEERHPSPTSTSTFGPE